MFRKTELLAMAAALALTTGPIVVPENFGWDPRLGKRKVKPRNKRGTTPRTYVVGEPKAHKDRNKKGRP